MVDQHRDVFAALAQRRHVDVDDAQPVEQVLAELAGRDALGQVAVGRRDDAHVGDARGAVRADRLDFAGLEEAQQQRLHAQAHLADFVEEQRAAVRELQLAGLVAIRAGEAAFDVAEELRLEQRLGQAGAVHGDEGAVRARVECTWTVRAIEILADAALARDQTLDSPAAARRAMASTSSMAGLAAMMFGAPPGISSRCCVNPRRCRSVTFNMTLRSLRGPGALPPASCRASGAPARPVD